MADLGNRTNVDTAINLLLNDAQPNEAIQPSDHNTLLINILDTLSSGLSNTLRTNPETSGQDLEVTSGDKIKFKNSTFFGSIISGTLTSDKTYTLPDTTGTIALLSDITGTDVNAVHVNVQAEISAITAKATPTTSDILLIEDSADTNKKKKITIGDLPSSGGGNNIYNSNGTLVSNIIVTQGNKTLTFDGAGGFPIIKQNLGASTNGQKVLEIKATHLGAITGCGGYIDFSSANGNYNVGRIHNYQFGSNNAGFRIFSLATNGTANLGNSYLGQDGHSALIGENVVSRIGTEKVSLQGHTAIKGKNTLSTASALQIYDGDGTPNLLWDFRNNGDVHINQDTSIFLLNKKFTFDGSTNTGLINFEVVGRSAFRSVNSDVGQIIFEGQNHLGVKVFEFFNNGDFIADSFFAKPSSGGAINFQNTGRSAFKGTNTASNQICLEAQDSTGSRVFEIRNNGDIYTNGTQGFSGTGSYSNFTIENGIITSAS